jgi:hypothetical protein
MPHPATPASTRHDFDFLFGDWNVFHRRLNGRLVGASEWTTFEGRSVARPILGGLGNIDENVVSLPSGPYEAMTLRLFDDATKRWSIWWIDGRFPRMDDSPMRGGFADGVGTFYGDDVHDGTPVLVRFVWTVTDPAAPRWEQAFSIDGGATWEVNWVNRFERRA